MNHMSGGRRQDNVGGGTRVGIKPRVDHEDHSNITEGERT